MEYIMHIITLPFKLTFALVPPTEFLGGWACFFVALTFIGGVTCFIGDLASIFGCLIDWPGWKPDLTPHMLSIALLNLLPLLNINTCAPATRFDHSHYFSRSWDFTARHIRQ